MEQVTSTTLGLLMAYLLPGLVVLYSLSFWSLRLREVFRSFLAAQQIGLFLLVLAASLIAGLLAGAVRWVGFEFLFGSKCQHLEPAQFRQLTTQTKFSAFSYIVDENFRFHQFWGAMVVVAPFLCASLLKEFWNYIHLLGILTGVITFLIMEFIIAIAAWKSYKRFVARARCILAGPGDEEQAAGKSE